MKIIQNLWFFCSIGLILSIMVHNPKSQGMIGQNQVLHKKLEQRSKVWEMRWYQQQSLVL